MFDTKSIPMYLERLGHKKLKIGNDEFKGTEMVFRIDPFTSQLATELPDLKASIFRRTEGGEPNPNVDAVSFTFKPPPQRIEFRPDPEMKPSIVLIECKVSKFKVRKPKDGQQWVLTFRVEVAEIGAQDLLWLKEALFEMRYLSFEVAAPGLFDGAEQEARRQSAAAKPVRATGESAATH